MTLTARIFNALMPLVSILLASIFFACSSNLPANKVRMYVGTYTGKGSDGIYLFQFDTATCEVLPKGLAVRTENPSFLTVDHTGRFLYAVNEIDSFNGEASGAISAFAIDQETGMLTRLQQVSSLGSGPAHLSLDREGRYLLAANYGGGSVAVYPVESDGRLGERTAFMQAHGSSVNRARQSSPHAHFVQVSPDNREAFVADLGIDKVLVYDFDGASGALKADSAKFRSLDPGAGPRHVAFGASGKDVYVVNELNSTVTHFAYDARRGNLEKRETVSTLATNMLGTNSTAENIIDREGRWLYVSNRGDDSIVQFDIDPESGNLKLVDRVPCGGQSPRHITFDPSGRWLISSNQKSNTITMFQVNARDGRLTEFSKHLELFSPVCVVFAVGR